MPETDPDTPTELLPRARAAEPTPTPVPVFVDATGRRRRLTRRIAMGAFLGAGGYTVMVVWSLLGGPVAPDTLMPFSAPHPAATPAQSTPPAAAASGAASAGASTHQGAAGAGSAQVGKPGASSSPAASASPSASATLPGHRPTGAPGKPSKTATPGHGH